MNELKNDEYKNIMKKFMIILMSVALIALPTMAQQQEWQSTSAMQTSGSNYTPQINAIGATTAPSVATTTENYSPATTQGLNRAKKFDTGGDSGQGPSPIGDAMLPLMLMAVVFGRAIAFRRKRAAE